MNNVEIPIALSFGDVLLVPHHSNISSRSEVDLTAKITEKIILKIPLISINMDSVTGVKMAIAMGKFGGLGLLPRFDTPDIQADKVKKVKDAGVLAASAVGCKDGFMKRVDAVVKAGADIVTLDVAHGHMQKALDATKEIKNKYGDKVTILSGVIGTYEGAKALFEAGADSVRVGVGPGTICTTRIQTGHGVPQITAILEASRAAREFGKTVLSDGGTENSGDVVKALAAGASAVISGYQLAGTDEAPGEIIEINEDKYKQYNASTSYEEKIKQIEKNGNGKTETYAIHIEGVSSMVPYRGSVEQVITKMMAGVKSGLSYSGAHNIEELWENAKFIRVTPQGRGESGAHAVIL